MKTERTLSIEWAGPYVDDSETERSYICGISDGTKSIHILAVNGPESRPKFVLADDEGSDILPAYESFYQARIAADGWLS
jgi:hypothetical protein